MSGKKISDKFTVNVCNWKQNPANKKTRKKEVCNSSSSIENTTVCASSDEVDNLKYMNLNFVENSETSSQMKGAASDYQKSYNSNFQKDDKEEYYQQRGIEQQYAYIPQQRVDFFQQNEDDIFQQEVDEAEDADDTDEIEEAEEEGEFQQDIFNLEVDDEYEDEQYQEEEEELYHELYQEQDLRPDLDGYDEEEEEFQPTPIRLPPSEIFLPPSPRSLKCTTDPNDPTTISSKPLQEISFTIADTESYDDVQQATKQPLYKLLRKMIGSFINPNVQVKIGPVHFNCHMLVLQCYSELFMEYGTESLIQLPEEEVTPSAFMMAYEWMLADAPLIQREGIAELFKAANFMRIKELVNQCWICLDDDSVFREDTAYFLYAEARLCGGLENLEQLMMMRICRFFLTLVASKDFLELEPSEVVKLLSSNFIGVNTEIEVLMSGIRWLNYDWENRKQYVLAVINTVRFGLFPPYFLMTLTKTTDCAEVDRVLEYPEVHQMMMDGMAYSTIQHYYTESSDQFSDFMDRHKLTPPMERQWIMEKGACCTCNVQHITYESFLDYLNMIESMGTTHWQTLELRKDLEKGKRGCTCADSAASQSPPPPARSFGRTPIGEFFHK